MKEIYRILKKDGQCIISVPFGAMYEEKKSHRIYDSDSLSELVRGFTVENQLFFKKQGENWENCHDDGAIVVLSLRKGNK